MPLEELAKIASEKIARRTSSSCFACGTHNSRGLRLQFEKSASGEMVAEWTPDTTLEGFDGIVHGGIVSTVLDESMSKAVAAFGVRALTAELRVRLRQTITSGEKLLVRGWVLERKKRMIRAEAALARTDGTELARAWGVFLTPREAES